MINKKFVGKLTAATIMTMLLVSAILVILRMDERPRTDDAFLLANIANIAPDVSGRVVSLNIHDNQSVRAGDVLFVVDPEPYQLKLDAAKAKSALADSTLARMEPLLKKGYVTAEQIDQARAEKESARAAEAVALHDFRNTVVKAPFNGKIAGLNIAVGEYANTGHPLFTMIDTSKWYAVANFRETEIAQMKEGTDATVYIMAHPERALKGHVDSISWGVTSEDATLAAGGLPQIPKTLNWVRLAQRFPVRILLEHPSDDLMRIGASSVVVVRYEASR
jgi:membrane fusion protein, multidrug efflux system